MKACDNVYQCEYTYANHAFGHKSTVCCVAAVVKDSVFLALEC